VDLWHAREHLHDLARVLEFMLGDQKQDWLAARLEDLDYYGDIGGICAAARAYPSSASRKTKWATPWATSRTMPQHAVQVVPLPRPVVGSGVVEAGCKAIVAQRLKLSGMRWTVTGADPIIALHCREASSQWEEIWQRPRSQTATA
jgi:hypothetical protein